MKFSIHKVLLLTVLASALTACHDIEEFDSDPRSTFEQLWTILDEHYCFFEQKGVDWNEVHSRYSPMVADGMTDQELFGVCEQMLAELRDGHTNLSSTFATSYYRKWWSDYPQNYSARLVQEYYFNFNYRTVGGIDYGMLPQNVGYMHYSSFSYGPGHGDFSEPYPYYYNPADQGRIMWGKPVVVLCNRSTFSAANNFVSVMKTLPNVRIVGATTGGGSGMPFSSELTNGWGIRFSGSPVRDPQGRLTEFGVDPSEGCAVDLDPVEALAGRDTMLDFAVTTVLSMP